MSTAHSDLLVLLQRQLALVDAGRWDDLTTAMKEWSDRAHSLPAVASTDARAPLQQLVATHAQLQQRLIAARRDAARELEALARGRGAVRGYQAAALVPGGQVDGAA